MIDESLRASAFYAWQAFMRQRRPNELDWFSGVPSESHNRCHWPPLPAGRRPRALERERRWRLVRATRSELLAVLVRRIRASVPPLRAEPMHGPKCGPGCADCLALIRWRVEYEVLSGAAPVVRRYLFP